MADAAGSQGAVFQFRHRKKDGEIRDVQIFSAHVMLGDHPLLHSIIQDITDQKNAEDALKQTNKNSTYFPVSHGMTSSISSSP
jgi:phosphoenolpyruvate-protein kinase (PTS system EI component)